jgi:hypothetical protein
MNRSCYLISAALLCAFLVMTGCTASTGPAPAPSPSPATAVPPGSLAALALTPAEIPAGYVLSESREKDAANMSSLALQLGWQTGYVVTYSNITGPGTIFQTITRYPGKSIPDVLSLIVKQERSAGDMSFTDIPSPGFGDISGGYTAKARAPVVITDDRNSLIPATVNTGSGEDFSEVWFSKGTIFEIIRITGPGADAAMATNLSRMAFMKIV